MIVAHRIRLVPTAEQEDYFRRACGTARFAYNWALVEWQRQHKAGEKPSEIALRKSLNAIKNARFPWMGEVTKNAVQQSIKNLGTAYANFFEDLAKYRRKEILRKRIRKPTFKKKGRHDSFRADPGTDKTHPDAVHTVGKSVKLPVIGWVAMREEVRLPGWIKSVVISRTANCWFASFSIAVPDRIPERTDTGIVGVDLGVSRLATLSDGLKIEAPKPLRRYLKRLVRLSRSLSRKVKGSSNRHKAKAKLARLHMRIAARRQDVLHKLTSYLVQHYRVIVIEDLHVVGMLANRTLARAISDVGWGEFRRQLEYKAKWYGNDILVAERWFPSSKLCSICGVKHDDLRLSDRMWTCAACGIVHDRDVNAALNLAALAS